MSTTGAAAYICDGKMTVMGVGSDGAFEDFGLSTLAAFLYLLEKKGMDGVREQIRNTTFISEAGQCGMADAEDIVKLLVEQGNETRCVDFFLSNPVLLRESVGESGSFPQRHLDFLNYAFNSLKEDFFYDGDPNNFLLADAPFIILRPAIWNIGNHTFDGRVDISENGDYLSENSRGKPIVENIFDREEFLVVVNLDDETISFAFDSLEFDVDESSSDMSDEDDEYSPSEESDETYVKSIPVSMFFTKEIKKLLTEGMKQKLMSNTPFSYNIGNMSKFVFTGGEKNTSQIMSQIASVVKDFRSPERYDGI